MDKSIKTMKKIFRQHRSCANSEQKKILGTNMSLKNLNIAINLPEEKKIIIFSISGSRMDVYLVDLKY